MKNISVVQPKSITDSSVLESLHNLLESESLCSLASVNEDGTPHINTCYFASSKEYTIYVLTPPNTKHGTNFQRTHKFALNVFQKDAIFSEPIYGVQLFGTIEQVAITSSISAFSTYTRKFKIFTEWFPEPSKMGGKLESRFFRLDLTHGKIIDENRFGSEVYVEFTVK